MGTRADFYIGRGVDAEWLGSIAMDGYPDGIDAQILGCTSPEAFRHAVADFLIREDGSLPKHGWPWPWEDSRTTDYAYAHHEGKTIAWAFGRGPFNPNKPEQENEAEKDVFPNMKSRQKITLDPRSGLIVIGG